MLFCSLKAEDQSLLSFWLYSIFLIHVRLDMWLWQEWVYHITRHLGNPDQRDWAVALSFPHLMSLFLSLCVCVCVCVCVCCSVAQLSMTLFDSVDCSPPGSSLRGGFQARILQWVAVSYSSWSSLPRDLTQVSRIAPFGRWILYHCACHLWSPV